MEILVCLWYDEFMNRRNYSRELERLIAKNGENRPSLLLHCCCGPCSSSVLEYLVDHFELTLLWYNPNIYPEAEFELRYDVFIKMIKDMGLENRVKVLKEPWRNGEYNARILGHESAPEGGSRCRECFRLRLEEAAKTAKALGFDYFCTTITLSRHKNAVLINELGEAAAKQYGISWLPSDFKRRDGENRSVELCEKYDVYRQLYCGCVFSLRHREEIAKELENEAKP